MLLKGLVFGVALLHLYFLILEMFFWTKPLGLKVFGQSLEKAKASKVLAANQGLYNGFLAVGLLWSLLHPTTETALQLQVFFLSCVVAAGVYGAYTVSKKILWVQALPATVALVLAFLS
jgi:putative membrane protein